MKRKGQLALNEAPTIVMVVGLTFLVMATMAYIASSYGAAIPSDYSASIVNESIVPTSTPGTAVSGAAACNFEDFTVTQIFGNNTKPIGLGNFSYTQDGKVFNVTSIENYTTFKISYSYSYAGTSCNVTGSLQSEISNNTSIAGIVLTISLVGIILSVLIGVFVAAKGRGL